MKKGFPIKHLPKQSQTRVELVGHEHIAMLLYVPAVVAVLGLFVGRFGALRAGACPHAGKVWGAFLLPLLLLPFMMAVAPLVLMVSAGAAIGAGLTAHSPIKMTLPSTMLGVALATAIAYYAVL